LKKLNKVNENNMGVFSGSKNEFQSFCLMSLCLKGE